MPSDQKVAPKRKQGPSEVDKKLALIREAKEADLSPPYPRIRKILVEQKLGRTPVKVLHWFRNADLRIYDNRALHEASTLAKKSNVPLLCVYVYCHQDRNWHKSKPPRANWLRDCLLILQEELRDRNIPLLFLTAETVEECASSIHSFAKDLEISHIYANYEYELERLHRDLSLLELARKKGPQIILRHDQTVKEPLTITSSNGKPMRVFTPYHAVWCAEVQKNPQLLDLVPAPSENPRAFDDGLLDLFGSPFPQLPKDQEYESDDERRRMEELWPAGHEAGIKKMRKFIEKHLDGYAETRSTPALDSSSRMSPYLASGVVSVREVMQLVLVHNEGSANFSANSASAGVHSWVREIVFREVYKQRLLDIPHLSLPISENLKFAHVKWDQDDEGYDRWERGTLGVPLVDAGMRQINAQAWMHNRLRMNVASYLKCNLCIDYRRGEEFFANMLMDYDLSSNAQGWEPSFTVFNPVLQAEKNDPDGDFIRQWIPELRSVKGKAIFDPYNRLPRAEFEKLGYPAPYVEFRASKERALEKFNNAMKAASGPS